MPLSISLPQSFTDSLITLKSQYEQALAEAETQASYLRQQLSHVNALLLNQLVPTQAPIKSAESALTLEEPDAQVERLALAPALTEPPAVDTPKPKASTPKSKAAPEPNPAAPESGKRSPRPLLSAHAELTRVEAIAQLLQATPGQDVTIDQISEGLFGKLSAADHKAERKSLNTQLYKGQSQKRWQKGTASGTFTIGAPPISENAQPSTESPATKAEPSETTATKRNFLTVLPAFEGMTKLDAIAKVLEQNLGEVLHQDTIIQMLYGDLSLGDLKKERSRMDTCLRKGVKTNRWQKAPIAVSYVLKSTVEGAKLKSPRRKHEPSIQPEPVAEAAKATSNEDASAPAEAPAANAKAAKAKPGRRPAVGKAKTSKPKRTEAELVEILQKADIQI